MFDVEILNIMIMYCWYIMFGKIFYLEFFRLYYGVYNVYLFMLNIS